MTATLQSRITPFLWFNQDAEAAVTLYTTIVPESRVTRIVRWPEGGPMPAGAILTMDFVLDGIPFTALNGGPQYKLTEAFSLSLSCDTQEEIDRYWDSLTADGGAPSMCGWLRDPFGLSWQIVPRNLGAWLSSGATAGPVMHALLSMRKIDLAVLEAAAQCP